jgi:hypothetical protein
VVPEALEIARGFLDQVEQSLHVVRAADSCDEPA